MRLKGINRWVLLFLLGSLWGILEVLGGEAFFRNAVPRASVVLSAWGLLMLAVARAAWNRPGTSTLVGATAALFKLANAAPFYCHLFGILMVGVGFDLAATLWSRRLRPFSGRTLLTAVTAPLLGNAAFGFIITFIIRYKYWAAGGIPKVLNYVFVSGGLTALAGLILVPLGFRLGMGAESFSLRRPRLALAGAMTALVIVWTTARLLG
jgi:hypothetical protein